MEKQAHADRLKTAIAEKRLGRVEVADFVGVDPRTVTNWTSGRTMPSDRERVTLRKLLGEYDLAGDPVEVALRRSQLSEWRQTTVLGFYKKHVAEEREERAG